MALRLVKRLRTVTLSGWDRNFESRRNHFTITPYYDGIKREALARAFLCVIVWRKLPIAVAGQVRMSFRSYGLTD
ncbi:MAG: hypothetical protein Kow0099_39310 [Candidatus Abyssubacteria bacterium]